MYVCKQMGKLFIHSYGDNNYTYIYIYTHTHTHTHIYTKRRGALRNLKFW